MSRAASIRTKLKHYSDKKNQDFNLTLTQFGLERFLYRLSLSDYRKDFFLKGALLFSLWYDVPHRPTRDADFLSVEPNDIESIKKICSEVCQIPVDDGIQFSAHSIAVNQIRKGATHGGVRTSIKAKLDGATITLQIDIGFGDAVTPGPDQIHYPVILDELSAPDLLAYPKYTVVAEKFHAIAVLGMANSRMKDYFDLWILLRENELDHAVLRAAIRSTFIQRQTPPVTNIPTGLTATFSQDQAKQVQWLAFLKKNRLEQISLNDVISILRDKFEQTILIN